MDDYCSSVSYEFDQRHNHGRLSNHCTEHPAQNISFRSFNFCFYMSNIIF